MKATINVLLLSFEIPDEVNSSIGKIKLSNLSGQDLEALCEDFTRNVFLRAKIERPPTYTPACSRCKQ